MDPTESLTLQVFQRMAQLFALLPDNVIAKIAVRALSVPLSADLFGDVENESDGEDVVLTRQLHQRLAGKRLDVSGVDDRQLHIGEASGGNEMQRGKGIVGGIQAVFVVGHEGAEEVGGKHLSRQKVSPGASRLP